MCCKISLKKAVAFTVAFLIGVGVFQLMMFFAVAEKSVKICDAWKVDDAKEIYSIGDFSEPLNDGRTNCFSSDQMLSINGKSKIIFDIENLIEGLKFKHKLLKLNLANRSNRLSLTEFYRQNRDLKNLEKRIKNLEFNLRELEKKQKLKFWQEERSARGICPEVK